MLLELDLQDNFITNRSVVTLLDVLDPMARRATAQDRSDSIFAAKNQYLQSIDLRQNEIDSRLMAGLAYSRPDTVIKIDGCKKSNDRKPIIDLD